MISFIFPLFSPFQSHLDDEGELPIRYLLPGLQSPLLLISCYPFFFIVHFSDDFVDSKLPFKVILSEIVASVI